MQYWLGFRCTACGGEFPEAVPADVCQACGGILFAAYDYPALSRRLSRENIEERPPLLLERWAELLPFRDPSVFQRVTLGESQTPILEGATLGVSVGLPRLGLKMDSYLPTGSLKDRPHSVVASGALERKADVVAISSSGNGGAALAAHAARANLRAVVGVFSGIPEAKLCKVRAFGGIILQVIGGMDAAEVAVRSLSRRAGWFNGEAFLNPYNLEGEKTIAFEIALQHQWEPPDAVVFPLGNGACLVAGFKGFQELRDLGFIERVPRLIGVQFSACAPIAQAFDEGRTEITRFHRQPSFSTTLMHEEPTGGALTLQAVRQSGGTIVAVSDDEVKGAMGRLSCELGIFAEPAGAIALAGAIRLRREGRLGEQDRAVCLVSGSGLNYIEAVQQRIKIWEPMRLEDIEALEPERLII